MVGDMLPFFTFGIVGIILALDPEMTYIREITIEHNLYISSAQAIDLFNKWRS